MLHSMLKDSMLDLDNSRNDVVPQRTQMDDEYASVVESKEEDEESHSESSQKLRQEAYKDEAIRVEDSI